MRLFLVLSVCLAACGDSGPVLPRSNGVGPAPFDPGQTYVPSVSSAELRTDIANPFFPAPVGARWRYEAVTDEGTERIEIEVLEETRDVWGVTARVVRDTVYLDDQLIEDTWDWYGEDPDGNVWYLGEDTYEYENGMVLCDCGAWESGVDGALPGVVMLGAPTVGTVYRQEFLAGEAEDLAEVVAVDVSVTVAAGSFTGCIRTRGLSAIQPIEEFKTYCPGVGVVLEEEGSERVELLEYSGLSSAL